VNFGTVVPAANTTGSSSVRFDAVSGASDSGMTYVSAHQGVPGPDTGKVTLDLSAGNFAVVSALDAQSGGTNALGQGFVYLTNFSAGDVLYLDNFGNRSQPLVPLTDAWFTSDEQATSVSLTDPLRVSSNSLFTTEQQWVQLQAGAPVNNIGLFGDQAVLDHYSQHTALIFA
jgi:hypothetical protein